MTIVLQFAFNYIFYLNNYSFCLISLKNITLEKIKSYVGYIALLIKNLIWCSVE